MCSVCVCDVLTVAWSVFAQLHFMTSQCTRIEEDGAPRQTLRTGGSADRLWVPPLALPVRSRWLLEKVAGTTWRFARLRRRNVMQTRGLFDSFLGVCPRFHTLWVFGSAILFNPCALGGHEMQLREHRPRDSEDVTHTPEWRD